MPPPPFDDIGSALALTPDGNTYATTFSNVDATLQTNETSFLPYSFGGVWFSIDFSAFSGVVPVTIQMSVAAGSGLDPWIIPRRPDAGFNPAAPDFADLGTPVGLAEYPIVFPDEDPPPMTWLVDTDDPLVMGPGNVLYFAVVNGFDDGVEGGFSFTYAVNASSLGPIGSTCGFSRFYEAPPWRFVVTNLQSQTVTFLDHLATNRNIEYVLNGPATCSGDVPSDNPEVNIPSPGPFDKPFLAEGNRLLYCFRRECDGTPPSGWPTLGETKWTVRFGGLIMSIDDRAAGNPAVSTFTAYDPWQYLYRRPVLDPDLEEVPVLPEGVTYSGTGDQIILEQFSVNEAVYGPLLIDYGNGLGYSGTIETTAAITEINFQRGASLGEMLDNLVATGTLDVVLTPIYDPINRPGLVAELSIYNRAGTEQFDAIFGWDLFPRSLVGVSRLDDGTARANYIQYYQGQGGIAAGLKTDGASVAEFGPYWEQRFWPNQTALPAVDAMATKALQLIRDGLVTYEISPAAERAPLPFQEYYLGDRVPVWASRNLREPINGLLLRVVGIPVTIGDDELERIDRLLVADEQDGEVQALIPLAFRSGGIATFSQTQPQRREVNSNLRAPFT